MSTRPDAVVVGSGPNGLAAALTLARAGLAVRVYEAAGSVGGGTRTGALTLPGFAHDVCSAVHPLALASPFFRAFGLAGRIELKVPELSYGHPLGGGRAALAYRSLARTAEGLGRDGGAYRALFAPLLARLDGVLDLAQHQLLRVPADPLAAAVFALRVLEQGTPAWNLRFRGEEAPAMLTGVIGHSIGRLPSLAGAGAGLLLGALAHAGGWPVPVGGSAAITDALAADLLAHGGEIVLNTTVASLSELAADGAKAVLLDTSVPALAAIAGEALPAGYLRRLGRFRSGDAASKVDFALSAPVPWAHPALAQAPTVHLGGTRAELAAAEADVAAGRHPGRPFVLVSQPSVLDPSRAPAGQHVLWSYAHVPAGSGRDMTEAVTARIEQFAPGFRDVVLASSAITARDLGRYNANYPGGDISSGAMTVRQVLGRPVLSPVPWRTPARGVYLCSSAAAPGPGVHGMAGWLAARAALADIFALPDPFAPD
jgi:phytoene dehydrogenase-like protein